MEFRRPAMKSHQETTLCGRFVMTLHILDTRIILRCLLGCSARRKHIQTFFAWVLVRGGEKGKVTQKGWTTLNNDSSWWSSGLAVGCWGMGLGVEAWAFSNKTIFDRFCNTHTHKQLQPINNTIPTIHDKIVQNSKDDKLWDLQPVGFWTQAAWWIEFKHITVRLRPKNTLDPWN